MLNQRKHHLDFARKERDFYAKNIELALAHPESITMMAIDQTKAHDFPHVYQTPRVILFCFVFFCCWFVRLKYRHSGIHRHSLVRDFESTKEQHFATPPIRSWFMGTLIIGRTLQSVI